MASQRVRAIREGYYNHERIKVDRVFNMDERFMKKDAKGKAILPSWVESGDKPVAKAAEEREPGEGDDKGSKDKDVI